MRLHRLVLTNYRGITHREIEFPDHGVVVVSGANEIGKSSMIEALDLLMEAKDRSTKKEVKQVKPTHADVGAEITAEISTGPYRFTYRKRFHKRAETQLTVLAPRREQLTGDEAHDRVRAMVEETVDMRLWQAQRVLQAGSTAPVDLSGCDALSRALDVAAGEAVQLSGAEPLLIDRIDAEYLRYFTPTGRPTGEWAIATNRMSDADDAVARSAAAVAEVDDAVRTHATLTAELERLAAERAEAAKRLATARTAAEEVAALTQQLKQAEVVAAAAGATLEASVAALTERRGCGPTLRSAHDRCRTGNRRARDPRGGAHRPGGTEGRRGGCRRGARRGPGESGACRRRAPRRRAADRPGRGNRLTTRLAKIDAARANSSGSSANCAELLTDTSMRTSRPPRRRSSAPPGRPSWLRPTSRSSRRRHRGSARRRSGRAAGRRRMVGQRHRTDRNRRAGRADRAGGARYARVGYPGQTRSRTTGSGGRAGCRPGRRCRGSASPRSTPPRAARSRDQSSATSEG